MNDLMIAWDALRGAAVAADMSYPKECMEIAWHDYTVSNA